MILDQIRFTILENFDGYLPQPHLFGALHVNAHLFRIRTSCLRHASVSWHRAVWVKPCVSVSVRFVLEEFQDTSSIGGAGGTYTVLSYLFRDHISNFGTIFQDISRHFTISQVSKFHIISWYLLYIVAPYYQIFILFYIKFIRYIV